MKLLVVGLRGTGVEIAKEIVDAFLATDFDGGRHEGRVDKMMKIC